jgi:hypothetical protein
MTASAAMDAAITITVPGSPQGKAARMTEGTMLVVPIAA